MSKQKAPGIPIPESNNAFIKRGRADMAFSFVKFNELAKLHLQKGEALDRMQELCCQASTVTNPVKKAAIIKRLMDILDRRYSQPAREAIMEGCNCLGDSIIDRAKRLYKQSQNMDEWLAKLNTHGIGGRQLTRKGKDILASYVKCHCGSVSRTKEPVSATFCYCSCGWFKKLFEAVLGVPIRVTLRRSMIQGDDRCEFSIRVGTG
jgi:predicted hydrocarbon binding protein